MINVLLSLLLRLLLFSDLQLPFKLAIALNFKSLIVLNRVFSILNAVLTCVFWTPKFSSNCVCRTVESFELRYKDCANFRVLNGLSSAAKTDDLA